MGATVVCTDESAQPCLLVLNQGDRHDSSTGWIKKRIGSVEEDHTGAMEMLQSATHLDSAKLHSATSYVLEEYEYGDQKQHKGRPLAYGWDHIRSDGRILTG